VKQTGVCWPFSRWEWVVWSPFAEDAAADGTETTPNGALDAADRALASLIGAAERTMGDLSGAAQPSSAPDA
jgi:hypothetical protein